MNELTVILASDADGYLVRLRCPPLSEAEVGRLWPDGNEWRTSRGQLYASPQAAALALALDFVEENDWFLQSL